MPQLELGWKTPLLPASQRKVLVFINNREQEEKKERVKSPPTDKIKSS